MQHDPQVHGSAHARKMSCLLLGLVASTWGLTPIAIQAGESAPTGTLSVDALRKCADAEVAECQFQYGKALEEGIGVAANRDAAKQQYEMAYGSGIEAAGTALLRLTRQSTQAVTAPAPINAITAPTDDSKRFSALADAASTPITATRRNPGELVTAPRLSDSEYLQYRDCWKFTFTRSFQPSQREVYNPTNYNRLNGQIKDKLFRQLNQPDVRVVCLKPKDGTAAMIDGGRAVPLRYVVGENGKTLFLEEYQTSPMQTTQIALDIKPNGRDGEMFIGVFPLSKSARVSRAEPDSAKWFRGEVISFKP